MTASSVSSEGAAAAWNSRDWAVAYANSYDATPLPEGEDIVRAHNFVPTGRVWEATEAPTNRAHDGFESADWGCFEGERLLVEGTIDAASDAGYFEVARLPVVLDAPLAGDGPMAVSPGFQADAPDGMDFLDPLFVGESFGTVLTISDAVKEVDYVEQAGFNDWKASASWSLLLYYGDIPGRIVIFAYDPEYVDEGEVAREQHYATPLDGIFTRIE